MKSRPRRAKTRAPTRPMLRADLPVEGIALGEGLDVFFRPTTPTTPLISPTSDDSSLHTFPTDGSPNLSLTSHRSVPPDLDKKHGCNSPMLKTLLEPAPRSRSTDNLEKFSPLVGRRSQGDTPLTTSPLARRNTTESSHNNDQSLVGADVRKRSTLPNVGTTSGGVSRSMRDSDETTDRFSFQSFSPEAPRDYELPAAHNPVGASIKLRSAAFDLRSPTRANPVSAAGSKTPVKVSNDHAIKQSNSNGSGATIKTNNASKCSIQAPATAPKPRPWSMTNDRKSGEFNNLLSDGSSPNTSAGNTPDSGDALDESTDSGVSGPASLPPTLSSSSTSSSLSNSSVEKRSVRELAASLTRDRGKNIASAIATDKKGPTGKISSVLLLFKPELHFSRP